MRNPYYERLLVAIGTRHKSGSLFECPNIKKYKGSPAVFEYWNPKKSSSWIYAIYIYEELETDDSAKFQVVSGFDCSEELQTFVEVWLQAVIDTQLFEKRKNDEGAGVKER